MKTPFDLHFVKKLTIREKAKLVSGNKFWFTSSNKKFPQIMMTDGPSGLRKQASSTDALGLNQSVEAICFPSAALTASSFNTEMLYHLGQNIGKAARSEKVSIVLGPGINIKRSPLAGRNFEYFSEDPYLTGELGSAYVQGIQNERVGVSVKHFAANNRENQRFTSSSEVDERTLREIYLSAFEKIVKEAQPASIMCSYNAINGVLNSENHRLLTEILRNEWGFEGLVMSDWGAVADNILALKAGIDLEMPGNGKYSEDNIINAIRAGELDLATLDRAALRVLKMVEQYQSDTETISYDKKQQHEFARKAADESIILLKNKDDILPLKAKESIAIIGELAQYPRYQGGGSSHVNAYRLVTPIEAAKNKKLDFIYVPGYKLNDVSVDQQLENQALLLSQKKDKVIFFAGIPDKFESEGFDKSTIDLPNNQVVLLHKIAKINPNIIVVLQNGSAISMPWKNEVKGIIETYLAGEAVGESTLDILTGRVNPSGKLAETFPEKIEDTPNFGTFNASPNEEIYHEGIFVGYRYYDLKRKSVNFPFGYGLSYTSFEYSNLKITEQNQKYIISVVVSNTGRFTGKETVQVYVGNLTSNIETPEKELKAFDKIKLEPGEKKIVKLTLNRRSFAWFNPKKNVWQVDNGKYKIQVGNSSRSLPLSQDLDVDLGSVNNPTINQDTYISQIVNREDLQNALTESGLKGAIENIASNDTNEKLMQNMPLRAIVMTGGTLEQLNNFIELANHN